MTFQGGCLVSPEMDLEPGDCFGGEDHSIIYQLKVDKKARCMVSLSKVPDRAAREIMLSIADRLYHGGAGKAAYLE